MNLIRSEMMGYKHVAFIQPHKGKRYAMYTQTRLLLELDVDYIMFIDSDTVIQSTSLETLVTTIERTKADTVTGDVRIYNKVNLLSFLVSLKYWYAFNVERAAQSFFGNVSCIAGPFGLYRVTSLKPILQQWIEQTFMGKDCTFGDDRHLTNLILKSGGTAYYNHKAVCFTDTPTHVRRFISQQTRWGKSFIREYIINFTWFNKRQLWLLYDLSFMTVYSWFLTIYVVYLLIQFNFLSNMIFLFAILMATLVRSIYALYYTKEFRHMVFILYAYVFFLLLIPIKIWACFTVNVTQWGTGNRLVKKSKNIDLIPIGSWIAFVIASYSISLAFQIRDGFNWTHWLFLGMNTSITMFAFAIYKFYRPQHSIVLEEVIIK